MWGKGGETFLEKSPFILSEAKVNSSRKVPFPHAPLSPLQKTLYWVGMQDEAKGLRWYVGVPVVTNPIIALDIVLAALVVWLGASIFIALGQQFIGDGLTFASFLASLVLAGYLAAGILTVYVLVGFFALGNKYVALYRMDDRGVYVETMRGRGLRGDYFHAKPFPVGPVERSKSASRLIPWTDIASIQPIPGMRIIILKNARGGTITKVYCPNEKIYTDATTAILDRG